MTAGDWCAGRSRCCDRQRRSRSMTMPCCATATSLTAARRQHGVTAKSDHLARASPRPPPLRQTPARMARISPPADARPGPLLPPLRVPAGSPDPPLPAHPRHHCYARTMPALRRPLRPHLPLPSSPAPPPPPPPRRRPLRSSCLLPTGGHRQPPHPHEHHGGRRRRRRELRRRQRLPRRVLAAQLLPPLQTGAKMESSTARRVGRWCGIPRSHRAGTVTAVRVSRNKVRMTYTVKTWGRTQTPSTGLRRPPFKEGAGKRCSECGAYTVAVVWFVKWWLRYCLCQ